MPGWENKKCKKCGQKNHARRLKCRSCGYMFYNEKPPTAGQTKTVLTYGFLKTFRKELDKIKQTPPEDRKK